jgi:plasmid stability protein
MAQVLVRQIDDAVVESLKRKAAARGTSLEGYVREVLTREARETRAEIVARLRARLAEQTPQTSDSTEFLRARRDGLREMEIE